MRMIVIAAAVAALASAAAAQPTTTQPAHKTHAKSAGGGPERPIDNGPYTPEANKAYQGGGVILEGAPGGPAPKPEATPPGQAPRNSVPR